jgi:hypothetical protein
MARRDGPTGSSWRVVIAVIASLIVLAVMHLMGW